MIQLIGWLNPWPLQAWLFRNRALLKDGMINALDDEISGKVPNLLALINGATKLAMPLGLDIAEAKLIQIPAKEASPGWGVSVYPIMVSVCLVSNPQTRIYSNGMQWCPIPGQVIAVATDQMHSVANFGNSPWIDLVLSLEKTKQADVE